jgi:hypothetical protein
MLTNAQVGQYNQSPGHWLLLRLVASVGPCLGQQGLLCLVQAGKHQHIRNQTLATCRNIHA